MAGDETLHVDPAAMQDFAVGVGAVAEQLMNQLAGLDDQIGQMLGGWRGAAGSAYGSAWELWHRGAGEVHAGLAMLAQSVGQAGGAYQNTEAEGAQAMRAVRRG